MVLRISCFFLFFFCLRKSAPPLRSPQPPSRLPKLLNLTNIRFGLSSPRVLPLSSGGLGLPWRPPTPQGCPGLPGHILGASRPTASLLPRGFSAAPLGLLCPSHHPFSLVPPSSLLFTTSLFPPPSSLIIPSPSLLPPLPSSSLLSPGLSLYILSL